MHGCEEVTSHDYHYDNVIMLLAITFSGLVLATYCCLYLFAVALYLLELILLGTACCCLVLFYVACYGFNICCLVIFCSRY